ncbi:MAG: hypothetical protein LBD97_05740, partial [Bifidobacteriaceae bacterium]|nr:hypothetical protein [Bifidobacteriaceae bacterium]
MMASSGTRGHSRAVRAQRIWTLIAATAAASAVVVVPMIAPNTVAQAASTAAAPEAQLDVAPAVLEKSGLIGPSERKDRRSR